MFVIRERLYAHPVSLYKDSVPYLLTYLLTYSMARVLLEKLTSKLCS